MKTEAEKAIAGIEKLVVPQGRLAGEPIVLADYQRQFIEGALADDVTVGVWSIGRGNAKTATSAALAVSHLVGDWNNQPQREVVIAGRTAEQAAIAWKFAVTYLEHLSGLPYNLATRKHPHFEIMLEGGDGPHTLKAISADGKTALGGSPTLVIADERAAWRDGRGEEMESALLTGLGKRDGRLLMISTSAPNDANSFSQWVDHPPVGCFVQEHRPPAGLPADDYKSLMIANPGSEAGIGAKPEWLMRQAQQAIQRGGSTLAHFRNLHRNERVATDQRAMLLDLDAWLAVESDELPPRQGKVIIGLDLGGAASMTASAFIWPETGRLEVRGWFPNKPDLLERGSRDHIGDTYQQMAIEGTLATIGDQTVPIGQWLRATVDHVADSPIQAIVADRFKKAEVGESLDAEGIRERIIWRGFGFRDGAEDVRQFQRFVLDQKITAERSLMMRTALSNCVVATDEAGNQKLSRYRSDGRIDPVSAAVLAVSEAARMMTAPHRPSRAPIWA